MFDTKVTDVRSLNLTTFGWQIDNWFSGLDNSTLFTLEERGNNMVCVCNCNTYKIPCNYEILQRNRHNHPPSRSNIGKLVDINIFNLTYFDSLFKKKIKKTTTTAKPTTTVTVRIE